jgi:hypothetical protein
MFLFCLQINLVSILSWNLKPYSEIFQIFNFNYGYCFEALAHTWCSVPTPIFLLWTAWRASFFSWQGSELQRGWHEWTSALELGPHLVQSLLSVRLWCLAKFLQYLLFGCICAFIIRHCRRCYVSTYPLWVQLWRWEAKSRHCVSSALPVLEQSTQ